MGSIAAKKEEKKTQLEWDYHFRKNVPRRPLLGLKNRHFELYCQLWLSSFPLDVKNLIVVQVYWCDVLSVVDEALTIGWRPSSTSYDGARWLQAPADFACEGWSHYGVLEVCHYSAGLLHLPNFLFDDSVRRTGTTVDTIVKAD